MIVFPTHNCVGENGKTRINSQIHCTSTTISCIVSIVSKANVFIVLSEFAGMASPCSAELLVKLLVPVKFNEIVVAAKIAPPMRAELLIKLLVPLKASTHCTSTIFAC